MASKKKLILDDVEDVIKTILTDDKEEAYFKKVFRKPIEASEILNVPLSNLPAIYFNEVAATKDPDAPPSVRKWELSFVLLGVVRTATSMDEIEVAIEKVIDAVLADVHRSELAWWTHIEGTPEQKIDEIGISKDRASFGVAVRILYHEE